MLAVSMLMQFNYMLFQDINSQAGSISWLDALMIFCANWLIFFLPVFLLIVWGIPLSWRRRPLQPGEAAIVQERRAAALWTVVACILAYALNLLIEQFVFEPRPFVSHKVHLLVSHAADSSFPSDHTAVAFAVVGMLLFAFLPLFIPAWRKSTINGNMTGTKPIWYIVAAFVIGCVIGFARVFVGIHYPGDILGGAIDGLVAALIVTLIRHRLSGLTDALLQLAHSLHLA